MQAFCNSRSEFHMKKIDMCDTRMTLTTKILQIKFSLKAKVN